MCGIAGFWQRQLRSGTLDELERIGQRLGDALRHRGPDDSGVWVDASTGLVLVHRRLAILDLSAAGHQPMLSHDGRFVVVFNGEIYNHLEIRKRIELKRGRVAWKGHSDTETLLEAVVTWGVEQALEQFVGMFAFALWDRQQRIIILARDRIGEKPLYYGIWAKNRLIFASELKAFHAHPDFDAEISPDSLATYFQYGYIPAPYTIYKNVFKLSPGTFLQVRLQQEGFAVGRPTAYWDLNQAILKAKQDPFQGNEEEAVDELEYLLRRSIRGQLLADVPVGAFLSGGVDSSTVVALMQQESSQPVRTFSIGFHEKKYDEAPYARAVAQHLGTDHTELYVNPSDVLAFIPQIPRVYDEPFADPSQIPTFLLCQLTRQHVTVSLSGDAGDELFGGYSRYLSMLRARQQLASLPQVLKNMGACMLKVIPTPLVDSLSKYLPGKVRHRIHGDWIRKLSFALRSFTPEVAYQARVSYWMEPVRLIPGSKALKTVYSMSPQVNGLPFAEQMMRMDMLGYLPDDILVKIDRAAMAVSLETRIPLLDHRVVEFVWRLPSEWKINSAASKYLLRKLLYRYVPPRIIERPKMGFSMPVGQWLRGPLREWAESLLHQKALLASGLLNPTWIRSRWLEHTQGIRDWQYHLWIVLMFQAWYMYYNCKNLL
ncbi:MAG: asparagine synthetase B [Patescibacteria group bacterium]|nr:MAG: asparagine synthetase B [Patescibacteria group bacterium]